MTRGKDKDNTRNYDIMNITVDTALGTFSGNLKDDLEIDIDNLSDSFIDQPGKYAWWAVLASQARAITDSARSEMENHRDWMNKTLMGELDKEVRIELDRDGEKITENKVEKAIFISPKYLAANERYEVLKDAYLEAVKNSTLLEAARESMNQRKDMLISLGAQLRYEGSNTELEIKKEKAKQIIKNSRNSKG